MWSSSGNDYTPLWNFLHDLQSDADYLDAGRERRTLQSNLCGGCYTTYMEYINTGWPMSKFAIFNQLIQICKVTDVQFLPLPLALRVSCAKLFPNSKAFKRDSKSSILLKRCCASWRDIWQIENKSWMEISWSGLQTWK